MQVVLSAFGRDQTVGLESLSDWLRREPDLRGRVSWQQGVPDSTRGDRHDGHDERDEQDIVE